MPGGDRTGPMGTGPMTGRGAGYCAGFQTAGYANPMPGRGFTRGRGGRGFRRGFGRGMGFSGTGPYAYGSALSSQEQKKQEELLPKQLQLME